MKSKIKEIQEGNQASYEMLEKEFHPAIHRLINKWGFGYDRDEYFQIGRITFYECVMKFDDSRGAKLITYFMNTLNYKFSDLKKESEMMLSLMRNNFIPHQMNHFIYY